MWSATKICTAKPGVGVWISSASCGDPGAGVQVEPEPHAAGLAQGAFVVAARCSRSCSGRCRRRSRSGRGFRGPSRTGCSRVPRTGRAAPARGPPARMPRAPRRCLCGCCPPPGTARSRRSPRSGRASTASAPGGASATAGRRRARPGSVRRTVVTSPVAWPVRDASSASTSSRSATMLAASG